MADNRHALKDPVVRAALGGAVFLLAREALARLKEDELRGEVALITGGSRGLGLALARELAAEGCPIVICARDADELDRAREDLERRGARVLAVQADVGDRAEVDRVVDEATRRFGRVDILVNNAGVIATGPMETMSEQDFDQMMKVMFWSNVHTVWAVLPQMRDRRKGRIVNVTSIGGKVAVPHLLTYSAAKFAAVGFSEGLRAELARYRIAVTTVVPGLMRTGSYLNAGMKGQKGKEFALFGLIDNLPVSSISATSAAREIVRAIKRRDAEVVLSLPAKALSLFHGLFSGATADLWGLVNRFLPGAGAGETGLEKGMDIQKRTGTATLADPLGLGRKAAEDLNQNHEGNGHTKGSKVDYSLSPRIRNR